MASRPTPRAPSAAARERRETFRLHPSRQRSGRSRDRSDPCTAGAVQCLAPTGTRRARLGVRKRCLTRAMQCLGPAGTCQAPFFLPLLSSHFFLRASVPP